MPPAEPRPCEVVTLGEALGVFTPREAGPMRRIDSFTKDVGGAELNVAVALAHLGHSARWLGAVGDDEIGHQAIETLRAAGVDVEHALIVPGGRTGMYLKEFGAFGDLRVEYYRDHSPASLLSADDVDAAAVTGAQIVHLTGITASLQPHGRDVVQAVLAAAQAAGCLVTFDVNVRHRLLQDRDARAVLGDTLAAADVVVTSDAEAADLLGATDEAGLAAAFDDLHARLLVVHSAGGALAIDEHSTTRVDTSPVERVVDTVGAGDAFMSGLIAGLLRGWDTERVLRLANACGGYAVGVLGDSRSMPVGTAVRRILNDQVDAER